MTSIAYHIIGRKSAQNALAMVMGEDSSIKPWPLEKRDKVWSSLPGGKENWLVIEFTLPQTMVIKGKTKAISASHLINLMKEALKQGGYKDSELNSPPVKTGQVGGEMVSQGRLFLRADKLDAARHYIAAHREKMVAEMARMEVGKHKSENPLGWVTKITWSEEKGGVGGLE